MAHVTFVHGIANKPPADRLLQSWLRSLAAAGIDLGAEGVTSRMVYWADVMYAEPEADTVSVESAPSEQIMLDAIARAPAPTSHTVDEAEFTAALAAKIGATLAASDALDVSSGANLERIPLPWPMKKAFLNAFLRDVHHYLFNVESRPRPGEVYHVRSTIRSRFIEALRTATGYPHIVVSHSMGTVIAYDCLKNVPDCPPVDALLTIGSPLGIDEVQDKLCPGYSREDGFPSMIKRWYNYSDRLDPVCGFDPAIADDFKISGKNAIQDVIVTNSGTWRHSVAQYLQRSELISVLAKELRL